MSARTDDKQAQGVQVISRAAAILRALGPTAMSLGEIARDTGLPKSTVQRIVDALAAEQLVEAGADGVRPGWGLQRLATTGEVDIVAIIRPHLEWLFEQTRETVDFSTGQGREVAFLDRIICDQPLRVVPVDRIRALHVMANGKSILAGMTDDAIARLYGQNGKSRGSAFDLKTIMAELNEIRRTGFAFDREGYAAGVHAIGTPVIVKGLRPYALSIGVPSCRFDDSLKGLKSALKECRARCVAELSHVGYA